MEFSSAKKRPKNGNGGTVNAHYRQNMTRQPVRGLGSHIRMPYYPGNHMQPSPNKYTLDDLEAETGLPGRTIRSWISARILPRPRGKGRGAHFGDDHLMRIRFVQRVRETVGTRMALRTLASIVASTPSATILRVANGEEEVRAVPTYAFGSAAGDAAYDQDVPEDLLEAAPELASTIDYLSEEKFALSEAAAHTAFKPKPSKAPPGAWDRTPGERSTTIDVTDEISLRMRGDDPKKMVWLAQLARKLREWIGDES